MIWAMVLLFLLGTSAGMFSVPLEAYMQHRSPPRERGSVLAAMNFMVFTGILLSALLFAGLRRPTFPGSLENIASLQARRTELSRRRDRADRRVGDTVSASVGQVELTDRHAARAVRRIAAEVSRAGRRRSDEDRDESSASKVGPWRQTQPRPPVLLEYANRATPDMRDVAIARLLWIDLQAAQQRATSRQQGQLSWSCSTDNAEKQLAKDVFDQASDLPLLTARQIFLVAGLFTMPVFLYIVFLIPQASVRFLVWLASHTAYRIRVFGLDNLPERGGALLVANHVSWLDGILLLLTSSRPVHILAFASNLRSRPLRWLARLAGVILVTPGSQQMKSALEAPARP